MNATFSDSKRGLPAHLNKVFHLNAIYEQWKKDDLREKIREALERLRK